MKRIIASFCPLLLYAMLYAPYKLLDEKVIVEKFGCSCPNIDPETGTEIINKFNANDFTLVFWSVIAVIVTVASAVIARKCERRLLRFLIPVVVLAVSALLTYLIWQRLFWD